jgi:hypothetical protein
MLKIAIHRDLPPTPPQPTRTPPTPTTATTATCERLSTTAITLRYRGLGSTVLEQRLYRKATASEHAAYYKTGSKGRDSGFSPAGRKKASADRRITGAPSKALTSYFLYMRAESVAKREAWALGLAAPPRSSAQWVAERWHGLGAEEKARWTAAAQQETARYEYEKGMLAVKLQWPQTVDGNVEAVRKRKRIDAS